MPSEPTRSSIPTISTDLLLQASAWLARITEEAEESAVALDDRPDGLDARLDLYAGPLGIALFWAAYARVHPRGAEIEAARCEALLEPSRRALATWTRDASTFDQAGLGIGGLCGLGALAYTLALTGTLLDRSTWVDEAVAASELITLDRIARDPHHEVLFGGAGALLALLAVADCVGPGEVADRLTDRAVECGRHLLARRVVAPTGERAWAFDGRLLSGFSHGAAGILCALSRLHQRRPSNTWTTAMDEAAAFERRLDRPTGPGWLLHADFGDPERHLDAWCRGAPGILLGRVEGVVAGYDTPAIRADIDRALTSTLAAPTTRADDLCCGSLGRAVIAHRAWRQLAGRVETPRLDELPAAVGQLVRGVLGRAKGRGRFIWPHRAVPGGNPLFFQGSSGAGYALLYLAAPDVLPLPLALSSPPRHRSSAAPPGH
ncbi:MAG: lanthionine synthetase LanC family protein [Acidobacteriota bacterium]